MGNLRPSESCHRNVERAHFALWALLKSPLVVGTNLSTISPASLAILKAREVIAVNQDPLGVAGDLIWKSGPKEARQGQGAGGGEGEVWRDMANWAAAMAVTRGPAQ